MKNKIIALGLATILLLGNPGFALGEIENISKEPIQIKNIVSNETIKIKTKTIKEDQENIDVRIELPLISGMKVKKFQDALNNRIEEEALASLEEFKKDNKGKKGEFFLNYSIKSKGAILFILLEEYRSSEIMATGVNNIRVYNMNTLNNEYLDLEDLFISGSNYKEKIDKIIKEEITKNKELYFEGKDGFLGIAKEDKFYIDKELNLVIVYDQDEIAPHSTGVVEFVINQKELSDIYDLSGIAKKKTI